MRYLDPPKLFENRTSYRLLEVDLRDDPHMKFGLAVYLDTLDLAEPIAHDAAMAHAAGSRRLN